jgi:hypothetical protein
MLFVDLPTPNEAKGDEGQFLPPPASGSIVESLPDASPQIEIRRPDGSTRVV